MVRHILADGREVESIEGFVIPPTGATAAVYRIVADIMRRKESQENTEVKQKNETN